MHTIRIVIFDQALCTEFFDFFTNFFNLDTSMPMQSFKSAFSMSDGRSVELQFSSNRSPKIMHPEVPNLLLFSIYTSSETKCDEIEGKLKILMKDSCKEELIDISELIDVDRDAIIDIGRKVGANVSVLAQISKIEIIGEKNLVVSAKLEITEFLVEIERCKTDLKLVQWQSSDKSEMDTYGPSDSFKLERAQIMNLEALSMVIDGIEVIIDLKKMEERTPKTGNVRQVTRGPIKRFGKPICIVN